MADRLRPPGGEPFTPLPRALVALAGSIALIEVALSLADAGWIADPSLRLRAFQAGAFWSSLLRGAPPLFQVQPVTMFVTHAFLHGGLLHMVMNTTILLALGRFVSDRYGAGAVLPTFFLGAIGGAVAFGLLSHTTYPMVGASGAVFAFLGVWTAWDWRRHRASGVSVGPVLRRVGVLVLLNVVLWFGLSGGLAWEAHLGGFLVGLPIGAWLDGCTGARQRARQAALRRRLRGEDE